MRDKVLIILLSFCSYLSSGTCGGKTDSGFSCRSQGKNWAQRHPQAAGLGPPSSLGLQAAVGVGWARERCLKPKLAATCFSLPSLISSRQRNFCLPGTVGGQPTPNPDGHCFVATLWTSHIRSGTSDIWTGERGERGS